MSFDEVRVLVENLVHEEGSMDGGQTLSATTHGHRAHRWIKRSLATSARSPPADEGWQTADDDRVRDG
jgi:hypothetical protein